MNTTPPALAEWRSERVAIVEDYLASGISPQRIADDLGIAPHSLERSMARIGRHDLARRVHVPRRRDYRSKDKRCPDCAIQITDRAETCWPCWQRRQVDRKWAA